MAKRIGLVRKKFLTRERLIQIVHYLLRPEKQKTWSQNIRHEWEVFLDSFEDNITRLYYNLRYQVYTPQPFMMFEKKEGRKVRQISASHVTDQIVDCLLTDCLMYVYLEKKQIIPNTSYGSIPNKGQHKLRKIIINKIRHRKDLYVGVGDTEKFYPTMKHDILMDFHRQHIKDKWLLWLCDIMVRRMESGIALGSPSSNINGHVYHAECDWYMITKLGIRRYYRFCDNKFIIHRDKNYLHTAMREMMAQVENVGQNVKRNWQIVYCKEARIECLGGLINSHNARLKKDSRIRIERIIRQRIRDGDCEKALASWGGICGSLVNLDVRNLIEFWKDRYPRFFEMIGIRRQQLAEQKKFNRKHKRLQKILDKAFENYESFYNQTQETETCFQRPETLCFQCPF